MKELASDVQALTLTATDGTKQHVVGAAAGGAAPAASGGRAGPLLVVYDTETTGLFGATTPVRVVDFAAFTIDGGVMNPTPFSTFVNPGAVGV